MGSNTHPLPHARVRRPALAALIAAAATIGVAAPAHAATPKTTIGDVNATGVQANGTANDATISANGRWLAFSSAATNLVDGDTNGATDVFVRDLSTGAVTRIAPVGVQPDGTSVNPAMSDDGRWIAFNSYATNLVPGATFGRSNVYLYDRVTGAITRLSNGAGGNGGNGTSAWPYISPDGTAVAFRSLAGDLVTGDTGKQDVFVYRTDSGQLTRVSQPTNGSQPTFGSTSSFGAAWLPSVSNGGRFVAFSSDAINLVDGDTNQHTDVFVRDMQANTITRVSVSSDGGQSSGGDSYEGGISADGCQIVFVSLATNLAANDDHSGKAKAIVRDRCTGSTEIASLDGAATPGQHGVDNSWQLAISNDGCRVAFPSADMPNTGGVQGIFVRDRCQGQTSRMDLSTGNDGGNGAATKPTFSGGSGRYLVFESKATNLAADTNGAASDVFVRDTATTTPPVAALTTTVDNRRVTADASASSDADGTIASVATSYGDGSAPVAGSVTTHDYTQTGTFTVTTTVTDSDGLTATASDPVTIAALTPPVQTPPSPPAPPAPPKAKPVKLTKVSLASSSFGVVARNGRPGNGRGTRLSVTVSEGATLSLTYRRIIHGHLKNGQCESGNQQGRPCTFTVPVRGTLKAALINGPNQIPITGRTSGRTALPVGSYRLTIVAATPDRRTSNAVSVTFSIIVPNPARG